ncbi:hypothetical protein EV03_0993 [Prochlorococcus marinus str. PAC1]|uniref:Uncharacterized protein n=1 Tax=Prochlorococcus marinus str. PAC1 TaxID=59924 RepID=A0A0A2C432_PROMR|nr:hypothetical protein EV03_0993 [Prochlorococcus marinus str. PAC1]
MKIRLLVKRKKIQFYSKSFQNLGAEAFFMFFERSNLII